MKYKGSISECEAERNADLMRAYHQYISTCRVIRLNEVCARIANMPSARFWVSEERAAIVISRMMKGDTLANMRPTKREMFQEIYRRVLDLRRRVPTLSIYMCCIRVVNSPAPKFYMTPLSIRVTIFKIKRSCNNHLRPKPQA